MGLLFRTLLCMTPVILVCAPVQAQAEGRDEGAAAAQADGADPVDLLRQADSALSAVKSMTYSARNEGFGATATRSPEVEGTVAVRKDSAEDRAGWLFDIEGKVRAKGAGQESNLHVAFDGKTARSVDDANRLVTETSPDGVAELLRPGAGRLFNWMSMWSMVVSVPLAEDSESISATYEGRAVVGGVTCDVVRQDTANFDQIDEYVLWWFLGADDHLPRRLDSFYLEVEGVANGLDVLTITDLKPGADVPDSRLAIATPDGYEVKKIEAEKPPARQGGGGGGVAMAAGLVGKPAPGWTLKDPAGIEHTLADYKGKVVVIDFWATWCGYCKLAMPGLQKLHEKYKDRGVEVIGITVWEAGDPVKYMKDNGFTYGLLLHGDDSAPDYGIQGIPRLVVVGKDGTVVHDLTGYDPIAEETLSAVIDKALQAK